MCAPYEFHSHYWRDSSWHDCGHTCTAPSTSASTSRRTEHGHSTETALLDVLDGVYTAADVKQISTLIGLYLSAAFDTVDHSLLIGRLQSEFGVTDTPRLAALIPQ